MRCIQQSPFKRHVKIIDFTSDVESDGYEEETFLGPRVGIFWEAAHAFPNLTTFSGLNLRYETFSEQFFDNKSVYACRNVTHLDLNFFASKPDFDSWIYDSTYRCAFQANLQKLLLSTTHLTMLNLNFGPDRYWQNDNLFNSHRIWDYIPKNKTWEKLRFLLIGRVAITESDIVALLQRHSKTLESFHFSGLVLFKSRGGMGDDWSMKSSERNKWREESWKRIFQQFGSLKKVRHGSVDEMACFNTGNDREVRVIVEGREVVIKTNLKRYLDGAGQGNDQRWEVTG